jgi:hypothetical protein
VPRPGYVASIRDLPAAFDPVFAVTHMASGMADPLVDHRIAAAAQAEAVYCMPVQALQGFVADGEFF